MTHQVTWSSANVRRLQRHGLLPRQRQQLIPLRSPPPSVVLHAQVLSAAELSLALRIEEGNPTSIQHALWDDHKLIKTYGPRGTVHLLATEDLLYPDGGAVHVRSLHFPDGVRLTPKPRRSSMPSATR